MAEHIHPIFERLVSRSERERFLAQRSCTVWLTGLSGSGKSTIAQHLERRLFDRGFFAQVLDGDNIRTGLNSNLGFSPEDRMENIRRIAEVARLYTQSGIIAICSFISPTRAMRAMARRIVGPADFVEVFVDTPLELCEQRDVKGLYARARRGEIKGFTGIDAPYEAPEQPEVHLPTEGHSVEESVEMLLQHLLPRIQPL